MTNSTSSAHQQRVSTAHRDLRFSPRGMSKIEALLNQNIETLHPASNREDSAARQLINGTSCDVMESCFAENCITLTTGLSTKRSCHLRRTQNRECIHCLFRFNLSFLRHAVGFYTRAYQLAPYPAVTAATIEGRFSVRVARKQCILHRSCFTLHSRWVSRIGSQVVPHGDDDEHDDGNVLVVVAVRVVPSPSGSLYPPGPSQKSWRTGEGPGRSAGLECVPTQRNALECQRSRWECD